MGYTQGAAKGGAVALVRARVHSLFCTSMKIGSFNDCVSSQQGLNAGMPDNVVEQMGGLGVQAHPFLMQNLRREASEIGQKRLV